MRFRPPGLHPGWSSSDHNSSTTRRKRQLQRAQQGRKCRTWSRYRWYSAQFMNKIQGTVESSFICYVPHSPRTRLHVSECPLRNTSTRSPQLFQIHCCVASRLARLFSGLSAPRHTWISPPLCVVNVRLHGLPALLSAVFIPSFRPLLMSSVSV